MFRLLLMTLPAHTLRVHAMEVQSILHREPPGQRWDPVPGRVCSVSPTDRAARLSSPVRGSFSAVHCALLQAFWPVLPSSPAPARLLRSVPRHGGMPAGADERLLEPGADTHQQEPRAAAFGESFAACRQSPGSNFVPHP